MEQYIALVNPNTKKYEQFDTLQEAEDFVLAGGPGHSGDGFAALCPGCDIAYWVVDAVARTLTYDTAQEAADAAARPGLEQTASDIAALQNGGKDIALVLVELVDYLLANTAMTAMDFTPNVRQAYQKIKAIANRIKQ